MMLCATDGVTRVAFPVRLMVGYTVGRRSGYTRSVACRCSGVTGEERSGMRLCATAGLSLCRCSDFTGEDCSGMRFRATIQRVSGRCNKVTAVERCRMRVCATVRRVARTCNEVTFEERSWVGLSAIDVLSRVAFPVNLTC
jgi:hypothetical protein